MLYSRSAEYAIRALVYMARIPEGKYAMTRVIAQEEQIPVHFLAKILQELARKGLLKSNKGPSGGFTLKVPADEIYLLQIVEAMDGPSLSQSSDQVPWILDSWKALHSRIMESLGQSTVAGVAQALAESRESMKAKRSRRSPRK
ncbi:MAG: RrF2 family transcriptional regulator [Bryobacteraceae bacterium]